MKKGIHLLAGLAFMVVLETARAGTFVTINPDGNDIDWADVPIAINNAGSVAADLRISTVKFANDADYFYMLVNFAGPVNPNSSLTGGSRSLYLALDNDTNASTGFDIFSAGLIGAEVGWQNDFPFAQSAGSFNTGDGITGGAAGISPFASEVLFQEIRISRSATFTNGPSAGQSIFPNNAFRFGFYTQGNGSIDEFVVGTYEFAAVPEPSAVALVFVGLLGMLVLRKHRRMSRAS